MDLFGLAGPEDLMDGEGEEETKAIFWEAFLGGFVVSVVAVLFKAIYKMGDE
jgi:hypothetical protein